MGHLRVCPHGPLAIREEPPLQPPARVIPINDLQRPLPTLDLRRVQLAQVQHLPLDDAPAMDPQALAERVVDVVLAVFVPDTSFEEHAR
ncbi:MAG: hypothetical protein J0M24_20960 [Verrucomicrobia bacterium]|nr:hypothetical protein [Verrucomicrobiota bacterium]